MAQTDADPHLARAAAQVAAALGNATGRPLVEAFFDPETFTASYVVYDAAAKAGAIIDSVLDFDQAAGRTSTASAAKIIAFVKARGLKIDWILETHAHADHLSAAAHLQRELGGRLVIGAGIAAVQKVFAGIFNEGPAFACDGSQFDCLLADGDGLMIGAIPLIALHVPGHTPADMAYVVGDAVFVGDTMFMPDYGSARADFPGGDARALYRSVRRLMRLPTATRVFLCHDYKAPGRDTFAWETTMGAERAGNVHLRDDIGEEAFVALRTRRDGELAMPRLILPSLQVNIRAGHMPAPEGNGVSYLKLPLNKL